MVLPCSRISATTLRPSIFGSMRSMMAHIVRPRQCQRQAGVAVGRIVDDMPRFLETVDKIALRLEIVFDDENAHACLHFR